VIYLYGCEKCGDETERFGVPVEERDQTFLHLDCGGEYHRINGANRPSVVCYMNDRSAQGKIPGGGGATFTSPRHRARWAKENNKVELGSEPMANINKMNMAAIAAKRQERAERLKSVGINIAKSMDARSDEIVQVFDNNQPVSIPGTSFGGARDA